MVTKMGGIEMKNATILRRILYACTGLVIIVTMILAFLVIPSVIADTSPKADPGRAVPGILIVSIIHVVIAGALVRTIIVYNRGGRIDKGLLIGVGVLLLLLSLMVLDGASAYSNHADPLMRIAAFSMFICTGCNFIASVLTFIAAWYSGRLKLPL
jgi:hypothetical protein